MMMMMIW